MSTLHTIPGGAELIEWFGGVPGFHDAELLEVSFSGNGAGLLRIHAWSMTDAVDTEGFFVLDNQATVTIALAGVSLIHCVDFDMLPGIILDLEITEADGKFQIEWNPSYGAWGTVVAKHMQISLTPGKPR